MGCICAVRVEFAINQTLEYEEDGAPVGSLPRPGAVPKPPCAQIALCAPLAQGQSVYVQMASAAQRCGRCGVRLYCKRLLAGAPPRLLPA